MLMTVLWESGAINETGSSVRNRSGIGTEKRWTQQQKICTSP